VSCTKNLEEALNHVAIYMPVVIGDPDAIERIAYEFCETQSKNGVIYFEVRYCPHLMSNTTKNEYWINIAPYKSKGPVNADLVVQCVNRGLKRGQQDFGLKARSILCCLTFYPEWSDEILSLVTKYKNDGVVGIDVAGPAEGSDGTVQHVQKVFQEAKNRNIHRTAHAGENGGAENVKNAVDCLHAERIGHGYRVLENAAIYKYMKIGGYHFETCPMSSKMTTAVIAEWVDHAVKVFAEDNVNFSISTDDPTIFGNSMESEFKLCLEEIGLTKDQLYTCQMNAIKSCFLPENEKLEISEKFEKLWK